MLLNCIFASDFICKNIAFHYSTDDILLSFLRCILLGNNSLSKRAGSLKTNDMYLKDSFAALIQRFEFRICDTFFFNVLNECKNLLPILPAYITKHYQIKKLTQVPYHWLFYYSNYF